MKKAHYICFEGTEGVGKTTQTQNLVDYLLAKGYKVLQTKEPGTSLEPLTMTLRGIMLDNKYDNILTRPAREYISQAIRSIHIERVVMPAMYKYDYIIQDRGILSGYAYGVACGNEFNHIRNMTMQNMNFEPEFALKPELIYDSVIYLQGDIGRGLKMALSAKQEFETGDAIELRGQSFLEQVSKNMHSYSSEFRAINIDVNGKSIDTVFNEILTGLKLKDV